MQIFIWLNNQQQGPYSLEDINRLLAQGQMPANTMAWYQDIPAWVSLSQVPGIQMPAPVTPPPPPPPTASSSAPDYEYKNNFFGFYLGINLKEQTLTIKGAALPSRAKVQRVVSFADVRSVKTYNLQAGFLGTVQGLEFELNDLDAPIIRVNMDQNSLILWMARIRQVCNLR